MRRFPRLMPRSVCPAPNVTRAAKRMLLSQWGAKAGGGAPAVCECEYHASAYKEFSGPYAEVTPETWYDNVANNTTIISRAITITKPCCVNVIGLLLARSVLAIADFDLERPLGTPVADQEDETPTNTLSLFHYSAWEVLPPGMYTYFLVNRSGATQRVYAAWIKIYAFECTGTPPACDCQYHGVAFLKRTPTEAAEFPSVYYDTFGPNVTVMSQAITLTETCCVRAEGTIYTTGTVAYFELERPLGTIVVDQESRIQLGGCRVCIYDAVEHLSPGIYTYFLVNRSVAIQDVFAAQLKIIAVHCV